MKCPHCRATASAQHFRDSPACQQAAGSIAGMYAVSKRKGAGSGSGRGHVGKPGKPAPARRGHTIAGEETR